VERAEANRLRAWVGEVAHQGVVAEVEALRPLSEDQFYEQLSSARDPLVLALDGVQDPHNLGACLRTANACGVLAVVVPRDRAATLNAAARKVAAGAAEATPVVTVTNLARALKIIKEAGLWIVGADADAPRPASAVDLTGSRCLVLGSEGSGLRELTRRSCDWLVNLPNLGTVESLNVSVATGMLLYEALRQRQDMKGPSRPA
jgi:23S rRNA (guanosine2251-2'-O)-methyltransferase